jgi:hypothetical protein
VVTKIQVTLAKQASEEPVAEEPAATQEAPAETTETE